MTRSEDEARPKVPCGEEDFTLNIKNLNSQKAWSQGLDPASVAAEVLALIWTLFGYLTGVEAKNVIFPGACVNASP